MQNQCPNCDNGRLFFTPDGRSRVCEACGHRVAVAQKRRSARDLLDYRPPRIATADEERRFGAAGVRALLAQGIGAAKAGDFDEAYYALSRVLRTETTNDERAKAWLWLSQIFDDPAEKRLCLEQVLALNPAHGVARRGLAVLDGRLRPEEIVDPDRLQQEIDETPAPAAAEQFTCPRCAGHMNYTPDGSALVCEFCHLRQGLDGTDEKQKNGRFGQGAFEQEFTVALATAKGHLRPVQMRTFQCHNCAVDFVLAPETISLSCPYCNGVYVTETAESREIVPPHALIPFRLDEDQAQAALRRWLRRHDVAPARMTALTGLYVPVWTFDVGGELRWRGLVRRGDDWVSRRGNHLIFYDDVLVPAEKRPLVPVVTTIDHFDLAQLVAYDARYLADWPAERYQFPLADASIVARKKVLKDLRRHPHNYTNGESVRDLRFNSTGIFVESFKHILLPLWLAHYTVDGKQYDVVVNGQNGDVAGERPQGVVRSFFARLLG